MSDRGRIARSEIGIARASRSSRGPSIEVRRTDSSISSIALTQHNHHHTRPRHLKKITGSTTSRSFIMTSIKDFKLAPLSPVPSDIEVGGGAGL